jgi:hypothetical protein
MTGLAPARHKLAFSAQVLPSQEARTDERTKTHTKHGQHIQETGTTTKKRQKSAIIGLSGGVHAAYTHKSRTRRNARTDRQNTKVCLSVRAPMSRNLNVQKKYLLNFSSPPFTQKIEKSPRGRVTHSHTHRVPFNTLHPLIRLAAWPACFQHISLIKTNPAARSCGAAIL